MGVKMEVSTAKGGCHRPIRKSGSERPILGRFWGSILDWFGKRFWVGLGVDFGSVWGSTLYLQCLREPTPDLPRLAAVMLTN